ncbi:MAG: o-succinylbenzoate synthase [Propioniciclava sp.]
MRPSPRWPDPERLSVIVVYSTPLTDRFRGLRARDGVLVHGPAGWGEFSPFWDYDDATCISWLRAAVAAATEPFPEARRTRVAVNAIVPAVGPERARAIVAEAGCTTVKVTVAQAGQRLRDDRDRVAAVREALGPSGAIRIDANAAWTLAEASDAVPALDRAAGGLQYAEQPVADVADLARLRRRIAVPVAADESIRRAEDPLAVRRARAADVVVMKVQPLGGVAACLRLAEQIDLPVVVSSALESSVGIAQGVALAAALPPVDDERFAQPDGAPLAAGLGTVRLFRDDVAATPLIPEGGWLPVGRVEPDTVPVAPPDVQRRWHERLGRVADLAGINLAGLDPQGVVG